GEGGDVSERAGDPVGLVFRSLGLGILVGLALQATVTWTVRTLQPPGGPAGPSLSSAPALVLLLGTFGGIIAAGAATYLVLGPIQNPWRQAMLAMITGLGSFVISLVTLPIDRALGRPGLLALAALAAAASVLLWRRLPRRREARTG
ncbi:MAG: hypothetical protein ACT4PM_09180, partial [Gemmatimonadales bacterium]